MDLWFGNYYASITALPQTPNGSSYLQYPGSLELIKKKGLLPSISLVAQLVKNPPAMQEIQVPFLGKEEPLEKGMATHSSILA